MKPSERGRQVAGLLGVVSVLLTAALVGMARESAPASPAESVPSPVPLAAILPPADLSALLRGSDVARVVEGERGERSSASALPLTTLAADVSVPVAASSAAGQGPASAPGVTLTPSEAGWWGRQLSPAQMYGLAIYVTDDAWWAEFARECFAGGGENRGYVGAVNGPNDNGTYDGGIGQHNDETLAGLGLDAERVRRDPVYAMEGLYRTYEIQGAGAWFGCAPGASVGAAAGGDGPGR